MSSIAGRWSLLVQLVNSEVLPQHHLPCTLPQILTAPLVPVFAQVHGTLEKSW